ncbi:MAG: hypothetical protein ACK5XN_12915, partial [Bacteroidota bacterium]
MDQTLNKKATPDAAIPTSCADVTGYHDELPLIAQFQSIVTRQIVDSKDNDSTVVESQKEKLELKNALKASNCNVTMNMIDAFLKVCVTLNTISKNNFVFRLGNRSKETMETSEVTNGDEKEQEVVVLSQSTRLNICRCKNSRESDKVICHKNCGCVRGKIACSEMCGCYKICVERPEVRCATKVEQVIQRVCLDDGSIMSDQKTTDNGVMSDETKESLQSMALTTSVKVLEQRVMALEHLVMTGPKAKQPDDVVNSHTLTPLKTPPSAGTRVERPETKSITDNRGKAGAVLSGWTQVSRRNNEKKGNRVCTDDRSSSNNREVVDPALVMYNYPIYQERISLSRHIE